MEIIADSDAYNHYDLNLSRNFASGVVPMSLQNLFCISLFQGPGLAWMRILTKALGMTM